MKFKKELIIDYTELPQEIKDLVIKRYEHSNISNGCIKNFYIHDEQKPRSEYKGGEILHIDKEIDYIVERGDCPISDYFYDQGLTKRQDVNIKIWW